MLLWLLGNLHRVSHHMLILGLHFWCNYFFNGFVRTFSNFLQLFDLGFELLLQLMFFVEPVEELLDPDPLLLNLFQVALDGYLRFG